jgi:mono/diheme cytochrome c family protein
MMSILLTPGLRALLALICLMCTSSSPGQIAAEEGPSPDAGRAVYLRVGCDACHGTVGHGGAGPRLAPPGVLPFAALQAWVRNGTQGWSIARGMPAFPESALSDEELEAISAYLVSIPEPPPLEDIPLLDLEPF